MSKFLLLVVLSTGLLLQSCSKKSGTGDDPTPVDPGVGETATLKIIPDSIFRVYLKANVCPNAFDQSGKRIDITHPEVKNFIGTMNIDTITCAKPYVSSLKGIEYFTRMKKLIVTLNPIDSLKLTSSMELDTLQLLNTRDLQYVALSGCTNMRYIRARDIPVVSLDLSNLPELNYVSLISLKRLNELKIDNDPKLEHVITYAMTSLKTVNTSTAPALRRLFLEYAPVLNSVDLSNNHKLRTLLATYCSSFKTVDLSKVDSLRGVNFEFSGIETIDFSHNPELFSVAMPWTYLKNLSLLNNPKVRNLALDGCTVLEWVDLRAQKSFDHYIIDLSQYRGMSSDDMYQVVQDGFASPTQSAKYPILNAARRKGIDGAPQDLFGGLRVPQYLDASGLSLTQVKINDAIKDNYSLVMARRVLGSTPKALITVYGQDMTTVLCNDYDPLLFKCN